MKKPGAQIFWIGNSGTKQCAMDGRGVWWHRERDRSPASSHYSGWGPWTQCLENRRPAHSWYAPGAGRARLPL